MTLSKKVCFLRLCDSIEELRRRPTDSQRIVNAITLMKTFADQSENFGDRLVASIMARTLQEITGERH